MGLNHGTTAPIYGPETGLRRLGPHGCFPSTAPQALQSAWPKKAGSMVADACHSNHDQFKQDIQNWLVVLTCFNPSEKYESMGRFIPYIMEKKVPNHQPENIEKCYSHPTPWASRQLLGLHFGNLRSARLSQADEVPDFPVVFFEPREAHPLPLAEVVLPNTPATKEETALKP